MKLIFTDDIGVIKAYVNDRNILSEDIVICCHWDISRFLAQCKVRYTLIDTALSSEDCKYIDTMAQELAKNWFIFMGKDFSIYRGISLGCLFEYGISGFFVRRFKFLVASLNMIKKFNSCKVVVAYPEHSFERNILTELCSELGLEFEYVRALNGLGHRVSPSNQNTPINLDRLSYGKVFSNKLKYVFLWGCENFARLRNLFLQNRLVPKVLFSCYRNENLILQKWLKEKKRKFGVCINPYAHPPASLLVRLVLSGALILPKRESGLPWKAEELNNIKELWGKKKEEDYKTMFKVRGISIFNEIFPYLDGIVSSELSKSAVQIDTLMEFLPKYNVKLVAVYDDIIQTQRILMDVANKNGIKTLVIQHGLDADLNIPDKLKARFLALWGAYDREVSIREGVPAENIFVTGNPYFDDLRNKAVYQGKTDRESSDRNCKILVITHTDNFKSAFGEKCRPEKYITTVLDAIHKLKFKTEVKVKIHPSESLDYYNGVVRDILKENAMLFKRGNLPELLSWCDIVILADSTVVYEANIMGCRIISLNLSKQPFVPPLDGSTGILSVRDSISLAEGLSRLWNEVKNETHKKNVPTYNIDRYMGKVDGNSTERVYKVIEKLSLS